MIYDEFRKKLSANLTGGFVFYGEEDYLKRDALEKARKTVSPDEGLAAFSDIVIENCDIERAFAEISVPSMFSENRLIELYGAEPDKMKESDFLSLCELLKSAADCLLIVYIEDGKLSEYSKNTVKSPDGKKSKTRFAYLSECANLVEFKKQDRSKLSKWVQKHFEARSLEILPEVSAFIVDYSSADMFILKGEIEKISSYVLAKNQKTVNKETVEYVASSYTEIGTFDFSNAIISHDVKRAFNILSDMKDKKENVQMILAGVIKTLGELMGIKVLLDSGASVSEICAKTKMKEYPVKLRIENLKRKTFSDISSALIRCYEADITLKSSPIEEYTVLENIILSL